MANVESLVGAACSVRSGSGLTATLEGEQENVASNLSNDLLDTQWGCTMPTTAAGHD